MEIKLNITGSDRLQLALAKVPEAVNRRLRLGMQAATRDIAEYARTHHRFISRTGALEQSITETVASEAGVVYGLVELNPAGTRTASGQSYGAYQHDGTDEGGTGRHFIAPRFRKALRWVGADGNFRFSKKGVWVRGIKPDPFIHNAGEALSRNGLLQAIFDRQIEQALKEAGV